VVGETRLAYRAVAEPTPGGYFDFLFIDPDTSEPAPITLTAGVGYVASVFTVHYVFHAHTGDVLSPSGNVVATQGKLIPTASPTLFPSSNFASDYYVGPIVDEPSGDEPVAVHRDIELPFSVLAEAHRDISLPFSVLAETHRDIALPFVVLEPVSRDVSLPFVVLAPVSRDIVLRWAVEAEEGEGGDVPALATLYRDIVAALRQLLGVAGGGSGRLRVASGPADEVGRGSVVVGPPRFFWEGMCDPDAPTSCEFTVSLIEQFDERAVDRLLRNLPEVIRAAQRINDATVTDAQPAAYPAGTSDLPSYLLTVVMDL
jgi:hypothetical protein